MGAEVGFNFGEKGEIICFSGSKALFVQKVNHTFVPFLDEFTDDLIIEVLHGFPLKDTHFK